MTAHTTSRTLIGAAGVAALVALALVGGVFYASSNDAVSKGAPELADGSSPVSSDSLGEATHAGGSAPRAPRPVLRVTVRDAAGPIRGAEVTVRTATGVAARQTNRRGRTKLRLDGPGAISVLAEADGHLDASAETEVDARGGQAELALDRASGLRGVVRGFHGQIEPLVVHATSVQDEAAVETAPVAADGAFRFGDLAPGTYDVRLEPAAYGARPRLVHLEPGERVDVELAFAATGTLDVTATLPSDDGARPAELRLYRLEDRTEITRRMTLRSGIAERLDAVPAGSYTAELTVPGAAQVPAQYVEVAIDDTRALAFEWPTGRIAGRVNTPDGPGARAYVLAFKIVQSSTGTDVRDNNPQHGTLAGDDGSYVLAGLDAGRYVVVARHVASLGGAEVTLGDGETRTFDLTLERPRTLETRVVYGGKPVEGALVSATAMPFAANTRSDQTDASGTARLRALTRGSYLVQAAWYETEEGPLRQARAEIDVDDGVGPVMLQLH